MAKLVVIFSIVFFTCNFALADEFSLTSFRESLASELQIDQLSIWWAIGLSALGGLLTNFTPCVYPMIPITLRLISGSSRNSLRNSALYAIGIVLTYSTLGVSAALSGGLFGSIMASKLFNLFIAGFMFLMALSMLGFMNFSYFQNLGSRLGRQETSYKKFLLMGCGAGLVAAPCTGPILAALLTVAATKNDAHLGSALLLFYSLGFALPYVFLGYFGKRLTSVKLNPELLVAVKLLFSAIMFSLGLYYLRVPLYSYYPVISQNWLEIATGSLLVAAVAFAAHLTKKFHQFDALISTVGAFSLGLIIYSLIGWTNQSAQSQIEWVKDELTAFELAKAEKKPIIIDFWAEWCAACKQMDETTFQNKEVISSLKSSWIPLKLDLTESNDENSEISAKYKLFGLPTLILIPPNGSLEKAKKLNGFVSDKKLIEGLKKFLEKKSKWK